MGDVYISPISTKTSPTNNYYTKGARIVHIIINMGTSKLYRVSVPNGNEYGDVDQR